MHTLQNPKSIKFQQGKTPFFTLWILPDVDITFGYFIEESINANTKIKRFWSKDGPVLLFISTKKINMGEKISY